jgi:phospholipase D-like protein
LGPLIEEAAPMRTDMSGIVAVIFLLWIVSFVALIWGLIDVIRVPDDSMFRAGTKLIRVLVILFANLIGVIVYLAIGRPARGAQLPPRGPQELPPPPAF